MSEPAAKLGTVPRGHTNGDRPLSLSDRVRSLRLPERSAAPARAAWLPWALCAMFALAAAFFGFRSHDAGKLAAELQEIKKAQAESQSSSPVSTRSQLAQ